jgi:golgin subfamily A protein 1
VQLTEVEKKRAELDHMIQDQSDKLKGKDEMMEYQLMEHSEEVDQLKSEHNQNIEELQSEIQSLKEQLENKDAKLNRLITELPDQPLVQTVLEGYSKSQMASTFSSSLQTPGGVYRKEVEPLSRPEGLPLKSVGSIDGEGSSPPAILPIENHSLFEGDQLEVVSYHELVELRKENELLQEQLEGKDKTIRLQQQKLADMKKTLSKELVHRTPSPPPPPLPPPSLQRHDSENIDKNSIKLSLSSDVNFQYLKNVVIKFLCCRDAEAVHLIKAIAMLLELSNEEEKYMRDFFDYKLSWFGTMPLPPQTPNIK